MTKCLYCYKEMEQELGMDFHPHCSTHFFGVAMAPMLPYKLSEMELLAKTAVEQSITVPGVQPKLSLGYIKDLIGKGPQGRLTVMDALEGMYILKPQNLLYEQMPENEHLSMKLADLFGVEVVPHSLIRLVSGELCYISKRIDRTKEGAKIHMVDFHQILGLQHKYLGTMEMLGKKIGELSVHSLLDKWRFWQLAVFNYLIGNNDMHLKNFSMWLSPHGWVFAPAYDLLNVKMLLPKDKDDTALLLGGKKQNFDIGYFSRLGEVLKLNKKQMNAVYKMIHTWLPEALQLIDTSFLSTERKHQYKTLLNARAAVFMVHSS